MQCAGRSSHKRGAGWAKMHTLPPLHCLAISTEPEVKRPRTVTGSDAQIPAPAGGGTQLTDLPQDARDIVNDKLGRDHSMEPSIWRLTGRGGQRAQCADDIEALRESAKTNDKTEEAHRVLNHLRLGDTIKFEDLNAVAEWLLPVLECVRRSRPEAVLRVSCASLAQVAALCREESIAPLLPMTHIIASGVVPDVLARHIGLRAPHGLDLANNSIISMDLIAEMTGLESLVHLTLEGNLIEDISPLAGLVSLTSLDLGGNKIDDISPLAGLVSLTSLGLSENGLRNISPLEDLASLTSLDLSGNGLRNISPLDDLASQTSLDLAAN